MEKFTDARRVMLPKMRNVFCAREYSRVMHRAMKTLVVFFAASSCAQGGVPFRYSAPNPRPTLYPSIPAASYRWFASTDPKNQNADYLLLKPNETRRVALTGGTLLRLWSTSSAPEKTTLVLQNKTRIPLVEGGKARAGELYKKAFTLYPTTSQNALRVLAPNAALIVTNGAQAETKFFYQAAVAPSPSQEAIPSRPNVKRNFVEKNLSLKAGVQSEFWRASTRGAIVNLTIVLPPAADWNDVRLRATWDKDATQNAVDVPLGAFAANFYGSFFSDSALWVCRRNSLSLRAAMPFGSGARLTLVNTGTRDLLASTRVFSYFSDSVSPLRFCARFGTSQTEKGKPLEILSAKGSGAFLGFSLGVKPLPHSGRRAFAYLEGNETIEADGRSYEGTGTEDFFNSAWYFPPKPFARPLHGFTFRQNVPPVFSAYRLMIPDAVPFGKNLRVVQEHGNGNNTDDLQYSWVAYWYQKAPLDFSIREVAPQVVKADSESAPKSGAQSETVLASLAVVLGGIAVLIFRKRLAPQDKK